jgi:16S rRNA (uracil1498-N3)-methyltransferase
MRFKVSDHVTLFDGSDREFSATIEEVGKQFAVLSVDQELPISREIRCWVRLAVALPKGDRQHFLVEKLVELGVKQFIPLETVRGVAQPADSALQRLTRYVIGASQQCGRNQLMEILPPVSVQQLAMQTPVKFACFLADMNGEPIQNLVSNLKLPLDQPVMAAIGPEGGFEESEIQTLIAAQWQAIKLGPATLRTETAAIAAATIFGIGRCH